MAVKNRISAGETVVVGVAGWLALNVFARLIAPLFNITFDLTAPFFGGILFPGADRMVQFWAGRGLYVAAVIGWSFVYRWAKDFLPGPGWVRGLIFGTGIWLAAALALPLFGLLALATAGAPPPVPGSMAIPYPGLLGIGFKGIKGLALSVLAHQALGVTLGTLTALREGAVV